MLQTDRHLLVRRGTAEKERQVRKRGRQRRRVDTHLRNRRKRAERLDNDTLRRAELLKLEILSCVVDVVPDLVDDWLDDNWQSEELLQIRDGEAEKEGEQGQPACQPEGAKGPVPTWKHQSEVTD